MKKRFMFLFLALLLPCLCLFSACNEEPQNQEIIPSDAIVWYGFSKASQAKDFNPFTGNAEKQTEYQKIAQSFVVENGVAKIYGSGAWFEYSDLNFTENTYELSYDLVINANNIPNINDGRFSLDIGEKTAWNNASFSIYEKEGKIYISEGLFNEVKAEELTVPVLKVKTEFKVENNEFNMTTTISSGEALNFVVAKKQTTVPTAIYWDVYFPGENVAKPMAFLDNFKLAAYAI